MHKYYQYSLEVWNPFDEDIESRTGIVASFNIEEATEELTEFYGNEVKITMLEPLMEEPVLDFDYASEVSEGFEAYL